MYHWIRDPGRSRFPWLTSLPEDEFGRHLDYLEHTRELVSMDDIVQHYSTGQPLPPRACHLTFDDGLLDHFHTAFPHLVDRGIPATFFPCAQPLLEGTLLDVHKIHLCLGSFPTPEPVYSALLAIVQELRARRPSEVPDLPTLHRDYFMPGRFDPPEARFVKRVCDTALAPDLQSEIVGKLFDRIVRENADIVARETYMTLGQVRAMARLGMTIGSHGYRHTWLDRLSEAEQAWEIDRSLPLLEQVYGPPPRPRIMCYPYGAWNETTHRVLRQRGFALAFTDRKGVIDERTDRYELVRLDARDLSTEIRDQDRGQGGHE